MSIAALPPPAHVIRFKAEQRTALFAARQPTLPRGSKGLEVIVISPHSLRRGPVKYEGGYKQQKLAAAIFPYNTSRDFFAAGLALNAGGGTGCVVRAGHDVCRTLVPSGFLTLRRHHWKRVKITLYKPASLRAGRAGRGDLSGRCDLENRVRRHRCARAVSSAASRDEVASGKGTSRDWMSNWLRGKR
jgi:hypothetical protein